MRGHTVAINLFAPTEVHPSTAPHPLITGVMPSTPVNHSSIYCISIEWFEFDVMLVLGIVFVNLFPNERVNCWEVCCCSVGSVKHCEIVNKSDRGYSNLPVSETGEGSATKNGLVILRVMALSSAVWWLCHAINSVVVCTFAKPVGFDDRKFMVNIKMPYFVFRSKNMCLISKCVAKLCEESDKFKIWICFKVAYYITTAHLQHYPKANICNCECIN